MRLFWSFYHCCGYVMWPECYRTLREARSTQIRIISITLLHESMPTSFLVPMRETSKVSNVTTGNAFSREGPPGQDSLRPSNMIPLNETPQRLRRESCKACCPGSIYVSECLVLLVGLILPQVLLALVHWIHGSLDGVLTLVGPNIVGEKNRGD